MSHNPYIVGSPINNPVDFYGREEQVEYFFEKLSHPTSLPSMRVLGLRRSGKTSFLKYVAHRDTIKQYLDSLIPTVIAYVDLQQPIGTQQAFFQEVARAVFSALAPSLSPADQRALHPRFSCDYPFFDFRDWLETVPQISLAQNTAKRDVFYERVTLRKVLSTLAIDELRDKVCVDLGVDVDDLVGINYTKSKLIRALIEYYEHRQQFTYLVDYIHSEYAYRFRAMLPGQSASGTALSWRWVILLDEFERLSQPDNSPFDYDFFGGLRSLVGPFNLAWVTASHRDLDVLCPGGNNSPFFNIFHLTPIVMGPLERREADSLTREPARTVGVMFSQAEVAAIKGIAGPMPYLIQATACEWFDARQRTGIPVDVCQEQVLASLLAPNNLVNKLMCRLWQHLKEDERTCLRQVAHGDQPGEVSQHVKDQLVSFGLLLRTENDLNIAGTLLKRWINDHADTCEKGQ